MPVEGELLNHYRVMKRLGSGGMGEVFLAEDTRLHRKVALKVLLPEVAADPDRMARFLQEARLASALSHPNAAHIYEIGEADGSHFLAMEYIEGETLEARLSHVPLNKTSDTTSAAAAESASSPASGGAGKPLPVSETISIAAQVADALDAAHAKGVIHRDIKPANLMVGARGHVTVLDFGLAKLVPALGGPPSHQSTTASQIATQFLTSGGVVLGTVSYMSPEQALGREVDHRSDIFSLGVVLYRMATGRLPFAGATAQETLARILQSQPDAMGRLNYELPEELERVVRKCLEKDRERRYASARDLLVDLRNLERGISESSSGGREAAGGRNRSSVVKAVIVDDEELARQLLREYLRDAGGVDVVAECANGFEAVKAIAERKPDLVFLDVQMPKLDGFEVLELIDSRVAVIFVTAYDQYAMRAFDANAVDYLLKPFSSDRFRKAIDRVKQRLRDPAPAAPRIGAPELSAAARPPEQRLERIVVKDGTKVHIIPIAKLDYVEAQDDYIALRSEKKNYLKQQTISSIETQLDPKKFVRIHRSYILNLERIARIEPYTKDSRVAVLIDGTQLPVSRSGHARLKELLGEVG